MKNHGYPMKMFCLMLLGGLAFGLGSCANQGPAVANDGPQHSRQGYVEPAAWVPAK